MNSQDRLELGREAQALLDNPMFNKIVTHLTSKYIQKLMTEQVGTLTANSTHATLLALKDLQEAIKLLASEVTVQTRNQK
jgi:hypothetical protein